MISYKITLLLIINLKKKIKQIIEREKGENINLLWFDKKPLFTFVLSSPIH